MRDLRNGAGRLPAIGLAGWFGREDGRPGGPGARTAAVAFALGEGVPARTAVPERVGPVGHHEEGDGTFGGDLGAHGAHPVVLLVLEDRNECVAVNRKVRSLSVREGVGREEAQGSFRGRKRHSPDPQ